MNSKQQKVKLSLSKLKPSSVRPKLGNTPSVSGKVGAGVFQKKPSTQGLNKAASAIKAVKGEVQSGKKTAKTYSKSTKISVAAVLKVKLPSKNSSALGLGKASSVISHKSSAPSKTSFAAADKLNAPPSKTISSVVGLTKGSSQSSIISKSGLNKRSSDESLAPSAPLLEAPPENITTSAPPADYGYYDDQERYMIYYLLGNIYLRPVVYVSGFVTKMLNEEKPYPLRRSSGRIQVVPYDSDNESMAHDYDYVTETGVSPANSNLQAINLFNDAQLAVYGEIGGGYLFEAPSNLEFSGQLHMAYWTEGGLAEEPLKMGAVVDVVQGTAKLFVCDLKHFVLMYDAGSKYTVGLLTGEGVQVSHAADLLTRIADSAKPGPTAREGGFPQMGGTAGGGARHSGSSKKRNVVTTTTRTDAGEEGGDESTETKSALAACRSKITLKKAITVLSSAKKRSVDVLDTITAHHLSSSGKATSGSKVVAVKAEANVEAQTMDNDASCKENDNIALEEKVDSVAAAANESTETVAATQAD